MADGGGLDEKARYKNTICLSICQYGRIQLEAQFVYQDKENVLDRTFFGSSVFYCVALHSMQVIKPKAIAIEIQPGLHQLKIYLQMLSLIALD